MTLSDIELNAIRKEAERLYPFDDPRKNMHHDNQGQIGKQEAYIAAATLYQERVKKSEEIASMWQRRFYSTFEDLENLQMKMGCWRTSAKLQHDRSLLAERILKDVPENWEPNVIDKSKG